MMLNKIYRGFGMRNCENHNKTSVW